MVLQAARIRLVAKWELEPKAAMHHPEHKSYFEHQKHQATFNG